MPRPCAAVDAPADETGQLALEVALSIGRRQIRLRCLILVRPHYTGAHDGRHEPAQVGDARPHGRDDGVAVDASDKPGSRVRVDRAVRSAVQVKRQLLVASLALKRPHGGVPGEGAAELVLERRHEKVLDRVEHRLWIRQPLGGGVEPRVSLDLEVQVRVHRLARTNGHTVVAASLGCRQDAIKQVGTARVEGEVAEPNRRGKRRAQHTQRLAMSGTIPVGAVAVCSVRAGRRTTAIGVRHARHPGEVLGTQRHHFARGTLLPSVVGAVDEIRGHDQRGWNRGLLGGDCGLPRSERRGGLVVVGLGCGVHCREGTGALSGRLVVALKV
jgi:hypothetical protein